MKKCFINNGLAALCMVFCSVQGLADEAAVPAGSESMEANISYFFGYAFGQRMAQGGTTQIDFEQFKNGLQNGLALQQPALSQEQQQAVMAELTARQQKQQEIATRQSELQATAYLAENAGKEGVSTTESGLQYEVITRAQGAKPLSTDQVRVHYQGTLINGQEFDSSIKRGEPAEFALNQVIPGWTEGLQLMTVGSKYRFTIPPELGYGAGGTGQIPPNAVLIFEVELLDIL